MKPPKNNGGGHELAGNHGEKYYVLVRYPIPNSAKSEFDVPEVSQTE